MLLRQQRQRLVRRLLPRQLPPGPPRRIEGRIAKRGAGTGNAPLVLGALRMLLLRQQP
jgi:hypothetical protein